MCHQCPWLLSTAHGSTVWCLVVYVASRTSWISPYYCCNWLVQFGVVKVICHGTCNGLPAASGGISLCLGLWNICSVDCILKCRTRFPGYLMEMWLSNLIKHCCTSYLWLSLISCIPQQDCCLIAKTLFNLCSTTANVGSNSVPLQLRDNTNNNCLWHPKRNS